VPLRAAERRVEGDLDALFDQLVDRLRRDVRRPRQLQLVADHIESSAASLLGSGIVPERKGSDDRLALEWRDEQLAIALQSDGRDLPADGELTSGLRRSERVALLRGTWEQGVRPDGTVVLDVVIPVRPAPMLIS